MKRLSLSFLLPVLAPALLMVGCSPTSDTSAIESTVLDIQISRKKYDYLQPWSTRMESLEKVGIALDGREILTTADDFSDQVLIRVQKQGRGQWSKASLAWIDYHANLAILKVEEAPFWEGVKPARFTTALPNGNSVELVRWQDGQIEKRQAEFKKRVVGPSQTSFVKYLQYEFDTELRGAGWGEPILYDGQVLGLSAAHDDRTSTIIPAEFIQDVLAKRKEKVWPGLGHFDFNWQNAQNPASLAFVGLPEPARGVLVTETMPALGTTHLLKPRDVILKMDGFEIDSDGDYRDPVHGPLPMDNLSTRGHWAGERLAVTVWRDGKEQVIDYVLPKADFSKDLVVDSLYDQEPEYLVAGGLVFQPLTGNYLQTWGGDWRSKAPFFLSYWQRQKPTAERPSLVLLSVVLPDDFNLGYEDARFLVLDQVNGRKMARLADLQEALKNPINGFHRIEFMRGDSLRTLVLNAEELGEATRRVMKSFGIEKESVIHDPQAPAPGNLVAAGL